MTGHDVQGAVAAGFEPVREEFAAILAAEGADLCAQVAAYHRGELVVDLWAGAQTSRDSLLGIYSASKGVTHLIVALLVQDGVLDLDRSVSHYWPEFGAEGKREVLLRELLSHQAGLVGANAGFSVQELADDQLDLHLGLPADQDHRFLPAQPMVATPERLRDLAAAAGGLAEREEALSALSRVAQAAQAGRGRVLFVEGEAGLGKTAVLGRARGQGRWASVGRSAGSPMESGLAFSYLGQALEAVGFAGLASGPPGRSGTDLRVRLFLAVRDWLVEQAAAGPVLLALDDLHWADEDSLALLSFLGRRLASAAVAVVATLRPWPDGAAALARDLTGAGLAELQSLAPLSDGAARALYLAAAPEGRDTAQADAVVRLASGNPLLVGEAARAAGPVAELGAQATPQVIGAMRQALLLSSFGTLTEDARSCAQAGAVLGSPFRLDLVEEVSGLGHDAADAGIGTLFAAGLLHSTGAGRAAFGHDLVAEAIYGDLDEGRRRRFHERAWQALARRGKAALATAHALPADLAGWPEAVRLAHQAGSEALSSGAVNSAVPLLEAAETLGGPAADATAIAGLAEALLSAGRPAEALAACERALTVTGAGPALRLRALGILGRAAMLCGDQPRTAAATEAALELAATEDPEAFVAFAADEVNRISLFAGLAPALARLEDLHRRAAGLGASSAGDLQGLRAYLAFQAGHSCDLGPLEEVAQAAAEAAVAVLASRGASNAEIAASLVVSVRTVEAHLSRVYAKLGLQSRRQLMIRFPDGAGLAAGSTGA